MSSTTSLAEETPSTIAGFLGSQNSTAKYEGQTIGTFVSTLGVSLVVFAVQVVIFLIVKSKLPRIYQPRTYLVPEKERVSAPPQSIWRWVTPVFRTSNSDFIQKCGLDAYFFLRYLRMLLKIFIPLAVIILPILLPLNSVGGKGSVFAVGQYDDEQWHNVTGLDELAWGNVHPTQNHRYWAHLVLAVGVVAYCCFVFFDELRGYIRLRQAYLTSPQHRLRASATTVLVSAIPKKWCTAAALEGLYDVFPGGIRNIWINRNFDELSDKVQQRENYALALESAETNLIKMAKKAHTKQLKQAAKRAGQKKSKKEAAAERKKEDDAAAAMAGTKGLSTGDPHQVRHTLNEALHDDGDRSSASSSEFSPERQKKKPVVPIPIVGQGLDAVGHGITTLGKTMFGGLKSIGKEVDSALTTTQGFDATESVPVRTTGDAAADGVTPGYHLHTSMPSPEDQAAARTEIGEATDKPGSRTSSGESTVRQDSSQEAVTIPDQAPEHSNMQSSDNFGPDRTQNIGNESDPKAPQTSKGSQPHSAPLNPRSGLTFWRQDRNVLEVPSPMPNGYEDDEFPLGNASPVTPGSNPRAVVNGPDSDTPNAASRLARKLSRKKTKVPERVEKNEYPPAYDDTYDPNGGEALWKKYLKPKDRETMRLPALGKSWLAWVPFAGQKVDKIDYCRKELARLNMEIEQDQKEPEKYPLLNSAFIQFNHQVAAHMACQSISHHIPNQMTPRLIEISPNDVIWDNLSVRWWERYVRTAVIVVFVCALIIGWAIPVAFTGALSQASTLQNVEALSWINRLPSAAISLIQGILPPLLLAILLALLPILLRVLVKFEGIPTGMMVELSVSNYYFLFLFVQVFLVVTLASALTNVLAALTGNFIENIPTLLAQLLPKASNYFFSYLLLQALSVSAGSLLQIVALLGWFILAPIFDSTARQKWKRQISLDKVEWGTFFPVYTNLAVIGLIYSTIAPLILVFNIITFSLFWFVYRYNTLYVTKFEHDTGGLLFPRAINQLFTGLYVMEICMVGLFFLVRNVKYDEVNDLYLADDQSRPCYPQGGIMIGVLVCTVLYQWLLNKSYGPLFRYLPITLEDDAVIRDEEFARAQQKKLNIVDEEQEGDDINDVLEARERRSQEEDRQAEEIEMREIEKRKSHRLDPRRLTAIVPDAISNVVPGTGSWADRSRARARHSSVNWANEPSHAVDANNPHAKTVRQHDLRNSQRPQEMATDTEAQPSGNAIGDALFSGLHDEIEDLTPEDRDTLVQRAFQHQALRARRPVIWIPRDDLGLSDDEIKRTQQLSSHIWISNEYTGLDSKARTVYRKSPPDFSEVDLVVL